ncbi:hypothetical protein BV22DRAFT_1060876 [Leucogyrophana mollusca]|uniref:Uncharacterized protein n=1 Tax=Leucogyrophana mollusca TaxID=85980 RepID=A0ACB8BQJ7_9AGAM|nr:hypothetical protein BV22DRAFT_1060876 [Leucogyrophana mollusca]
MDKLVIGKHIVDPRILSDEVGHAEQPENQYEASGSRGGYRTSAYRTEELEASLSNLPAPRRPSVPINRSRPSTMSSMASTTLAGSPLSSNFPVHTVSPHSESISHNPSENLYSNLATYTFGAPRLSPLPHPSPYDADAEGNESVSPLTPLVYRSSADQTPRPSVSDHSSFPPPQTFSSHPSQGQGRPAPTPSMSTSPYHSSTNEIPSASSASRSRAAQTDTEDSEDPTPGADRQVSTHHPRRGRDLPDTASQHTFGHGARRPGVASSSASAASSRSSSRTSNRSGLEFSSEDEVEISYFDADVEIGDLGAPFLHAATLEGRRGSLPMSIPGSGSAGDSASNRSILTLRRPSRSLDDDLSSHFSSNSGEDPTAAMPKSEPQTLNEHWRVYTQSQTQGSSNTYEGYEGWNLGYVLNRNSNGSIGSYRSSIAPSVVQGPLKAHGDASSSRLSSIAPWEVSRKRNSTASFQTSNSGEDAFQRHLQRFDEAYKSREGQWTFRRENADGLGPTSGSSVRGGRNALVLAPPVSSERVKKTMFPGNQEIWRSNYVGRFKVDRLAFKPASADPGKAPQQRINIRHIVDPYSKGNKRGGPSSVIHKHSRAIAFSIFRSHVLFNPLSPNRSAVPSSSRGMHMHTSGGIMLAPRKVQEQYTSTKTTSKLSTHGLLDEGSRKNHDRSGRRGTQSLSLRESDRREKEKRRAQEKEAKAKAKAKTAKDKKKDKKGERISNPTESTESSTATSSAGSMNIKNDHIVSAPARPTTSKVTLSPALSPSTTVAQRESGASRPVSPTESLPPPVDSRSVDEGNSSTSALLHAHRDSIDSDELPTTNRVSHAEAFGTLDPNDIEHFRSKQGRTSAASSGASLANRIFGRFLGGPSKPSDRSPVPPQQSTYEPPWITTASRDDQESKERTISNLNESFKDVGLLHSAPNKSGSRGSSKRKAGHDIFHQIHEDYLYMLLPLWAGETESPAPAQGSETASLATIPEERQYLLVWYVPFEDRKGKQPEAASKKKAKQSQSTSDGNGDLLDNKNIFLPNFHVTAMLVNYDDLRGTGIRVPSDGLAITGPVWEAMAYLQSPAIRDQQQQSGTVICHCYGRDKGFSFVPEGLLRLGLCSRFTSPEDLTVQYSSASVSEEQSMESEVLLTPIGLAVVEMVWLGCLAVTSFGPV